MVEHPIAGTRAHPTGRDGQSTAPRPSSGKTRSVASVQQARGSEGKPFPNSIGRGLPWPHYGPAAAAEFVAMETNPAAVEPQSVHRPREIRHIEFTWSCRNRNMVGLDDRASRELQGDTEAVILVPPWISRPSTTRKSVELRT